MHVRLLAAAAAGALAVVAAAFLIAASYVALAEWLQSAAAGAVIVGAALSGGAVACWLLSRRRRSARAPVPAAELEASIVAPVELALTAIRRQPLAALAVFAAAGFAAAKRPEEAMGVVRHLARLAVGPREPGPTTQA